MNENNLMIFSLIKYILYKLYFVYLKLNISLPYATEHKFTIPKTNFSGVIGQFWLCTKEYFPINTRRGSILTWPQNCHAPLFLTPLRLYTKIHASTALNYPFLEETLVGSEPIHPCGVPLKHFSV